MFPADATAENKSVPEYPEINGVVPEVDNKKHSLIFYITKNNIGSI